jgi:O-Antigen ligase
MRAALEEGVTEPLRTRVERQPFPLTVGSIVVSAAGLALVSSAVFAGGTSTDRTLLWVGGAVLLAALFLVASASVALVPWPRPSATGAAAVSLFAAFVCWNGASVLWSIAPERSWSYFNRGVVYLGFLAVGLFAGALLARAPNVAARGIATVIAAALLVALTSKVVPALFDDPGRLTRLRAPVGFWNALALLLALGVPLALWLATEHRRWPARAAGAVLLFGLVVGILLTYSRAGLLAAAAGVALWLAVGHHRFATVLALLAAVPAAVGVGVWAFGQPGISEAGQDSATRTADGAQLGVALVLGALLVGVLAWRATMIERRLVAAARTLAWSRHAVASAAAVVLLAAGVGLALWADTAGAWLEEEVREFANPPTEPLEDEPSRLGSASSNNRWEWWQEAWQGFRAEPLNGTGAGSFATTHRLLRDNPTAVTEPHNVMLQFLSETGIVGGLLAAGAAALALMAVVDRLRRLKGAERHAATALAIGLVLYLLHSCVDWDWDFLAVSAPVFAVTGLLLAAGSAPGRTAVRPLRALAAALLVSAAIFSLGAPWLAERKLGEAYEELAAGDLDLAAGWADSAHELNPVDFEPLLVRSLAEAGLDDLDAARKTLHDAVELQPHNPNTWFELGAFELESAEDPQAALPHLEHSYELDPFGPAGPLLAKARAEVE